MRTRMKRPQRLANRTKVMVRSEQLEGECEGLVTAGRFDDGWLDRIEVTSGDRLDPHRDDQGELWVCDFEVHESGGGEA